MRAGPTVTVALPVLDEERHVVECLEAIDAQTYDNIVEVLVIDGGSTDRTRELAGRRAGVTLLDNPGRLQATGLNLALEVAQGDILVRVDARARIGPGYVAACVRALETTGAALVGGPQEPVGRGVVQRGIAAAMRARLGSGPAPFRRRGEVGWVDTVYLGAFETRRAREAGGYDGSSATNEDAELAYRLGAQAGVWLDPDISSQYLARSSLGALARQYFRYGQGRAATVRKHPASLSLRQLVPLGLLAGLMGPLRRKVMVAYGLTVIMQGVAGMSDPWSAPVTVVALPLMHLPWAIGFVAGTLTQASSRSPA